MKKRDGGRSLFIALVASCWADAATASAREGRRATISPRTARRLEVEVRPAAIWCADSGSILVTLRNHSGEVVQLLAQEWRLGGKTFPGEYSYVLRRSGDGEVGGGAGAEGLCGCSHGPPCPEPCGVSDVTVSFGPGEGLTWSIESRLGPPRIGPVDLDLTLKWREARPRRPPADIALKRRVTLSVAPLTDGCALVRVADGAAGPK